MNSVYLQSVGVVAPGLVDWPSCRDVLTGKSNYRPEPIPRFNPSTLPVNERRRITPTIRLAMQSATEAIQESALEADKVATVFTTSNGDLDISDRICNALTLQERPVSPIDFHNSVHNAAAGYWSIGNHCHISSTSISAGHASFAAGLIESITQVLSENYPVMLVAYDQPPPEILANENTVAVPFSIALVFTRQPTENSLAELKTEIVDKQEIQSLNISSLEKIRLGNPEAHALLLLDLVAKNSVANCVLPYLDSGDLLVEYSPC
jgi:hypothetical protein